MTKFLVVLTISFIAILNNLYAQNSVYQKNNVAINGYDPVAYFTDQKPVEGSKTFSYTHEGVHWLFASQAHLDSFKVNPTKYIPQYGGYCAYGVSEDHKSPTDPHAWTIVEDKLYLNYSLKVKDLWSKDIPKRIEKANVNWPSLNTKP